MRTFFITRRICQQRGSLLPSCWHNSTQWWKSAHIFENVYRPLFIEFLNPLKGRDTCLRGVSSSEGLMLVCSPRVCIYREFLNPRKIFLTPHSHWLQLWEKGMPPQNWWRRLYIPFIMRIPFKIAQCILVHGALFSSERISHKKNVGSVFSNCFSGVGNVFSTWISGVYWVERIKKFFFHVFRFVKKKVDFEPFILVRKMVSTEVNKTT